MYQKCPVCNGSGWIKEQHSHFLSRAVEKCPTCLGKRIINEATGMPPTGDAKDTDPQYKALKDRIKELGYTVEGDE